MALAMLGERPATELHLLPGKQLLKTVYKLQNTGATYQIHNQNVSVTVICNGAHFHFTFTSSQKARERFKLGCKIQEAAALLEAERSCYMG